MTPISLLCPNCGAPVEIVDGSNIMHCPYCNSDVCIDDASNEIELDRIKEEMKRRDDIDRNEENYKKKYASWKRFHDSALILIAVTNGLGFVLVGGDISVGFGVMLLLIALFLCIFLPVVDSLTYPSFNEKLGVEESDTPKKTVTVFKTIGFEAMVMIVSAFAAFIICSIFGII